MGYMERFKDIKCQAIRIRVVHEFHRLNGEQTAMVISMKSQAQQLI